MRWAVPSAESADPDAARLDGGLDEVELARLRGLTRPADRGRFGLSRRLVKHLVAELSQVPAASVRLDYACARCGAQHGRPVVVAPEPARPWFVSIAHAEDRVLVAACRLGPVGVDVERVAAVGFPGFDGVALTAAEGAAVAELPAVERAGARADLWVRKEAILKAGGAGLRVDPATVEVSSWPGRLEEVDVGAGYSAAVAVTLRATSSGAGVVSRPTVLCRQERAG